MAGEEPGLVFPGAGDPELVFSSTFEGPESDPDPETELEPEEPEFEFSPKGDPDSGKLLADGRDTVPVFFEHFVLYERAYDR